MPSALQREREEERTVEAKEKITEKTVTHTFFSDEGLRHFDAYDAYDNNAALLDHSAQQDLHQLPVLGSLTLLAATVAMANQLEYNMQDINLYQRFCTENEDEAMAKVNQLHGRASERARREDDGPGPSVIILATYRTQTSPLTPSLTHLAPVDRSK